MIEEVVINKGVREDINKIKNYIIKNHKDINTAENTINRILDSIDLIVPYPNGYPIINNKYCIKYEIRRKICNKYIIYFRKYNESIEVIGVFHSRRLLKNVISEIIDRINE